MAPLYNGWARRRLLRGCWNTEDAGPGQRSDAAFNIGWMRDFLILRRFLGDGRT